MSSQPCSSKISKSPASRGFFVEFLDIKISIVSVSKAIKIQEVSLKIQTVRYFGRPARNWFERAFAISVLSLALFIVVPFHLSLRLFGRQGIRREQFDGNYEYRLDTWSDFRRAFQKV